MKKEKNNRKNKLNIAKILSLVCLGLLMFGIFIGINNSKESSIISNIKSKKLFAGEIVAPQTWGGCKWKIESNGKLFIYASSAANGYAAGEMGDITNTQSAPWYQYRDQIKTVQVGQTAEYNATPVKVKTNNKIGGMFRDCTNLTSVNFVNIDFSNATSMWYMFYKCSSLTTITGFEKINATKATNFKYMFYGCSSLQTLSIGSDINSTKVTDMSGMFYGCTKLSKINGFNNLKTSKVTDMSYMFGSCSSLDNLTFGTNFSTSNVTNMGHMFYRSGKLDTLDISKFDTRKVTDFQRMLYGAKTSVLNMKGTNFVSTNATNMQQMFPSNLKEISIGNFKFKADQLNVKPYPWGRGSWEKGTWNNGNWEAEGIYSAVERAISSSNTDISGTYRKVSNVADLFNIDETITYSIDKYIDLNNTSCYVNGNIDAGLHIINHEDDNPSASRMLLYVNNIPLTSTTYQFGQFDYIIIKIPDAVTDANSNRYDLQIKLSNLYINGLNTYTDDSGNTQTKASIIPLRFSPTNLDTNNSLFKANGYLEEPLQSVPSSKISNFEVRWNINMSIRNKDGSTVEGNFMFSAYDLDIRDEVVSNGSTSYTYDSNFSEGINLLSGFNSNKIYTTEEAIGSTWVHQEPLGDNGVRLRGMNEDNSSEMSEFMVTADASGFEFQWTAGQPCGTGMLSTYQPKLVKVRKVDDTGTDVSGALLSLIGNGANEYWTSDSTEESFFLNPGQHVLHEIHQPSDGYELAEDIIFWVDSENRLTSQNPNAVQNNDTIVMTDQRKNCNYTIEYYYDNVKDDSMTETGSALFQTLIDNYTDKNKIGYKFDRHENFPLTINTNPANNVIKVYYEKDSFDYSIEYYYDNVKDDDKTETGTALYQSTIDSYPDKNITGYKFDKHENFPLTIGANSDDNVIKVYYVKDNFNYTVEYYYDNVKDDNKTETGTAIYQSSIDSYPDKNITGYKFDKHENFPLTIGTNSAENIIKVYYVKDSFDYSIEYYYDNVKDDNKTETGTALYQSTVDSYPDKNITGYKFDKHENFPLTIGANSDDNVIKVYYVKDSFDYSIEYYYDNVKDDNKTETGTALYQSTVDSYPDKTITGYKFDKHENFPLTIGANSDDNVIKVYYVKDNFNYTVEYYYDNVKDNSKTETGSALYQNTIDSYTDKNKIGYRFDRHENVPLTISANSDNNVIKVYYVKDSFNYTVEYYYDNVKDEDKTETNSAIYESLIDSYIDKNIAGYKFEKTENFPLTITENAANNVIKVYYIIDDGNTKTLTYTVEYYKDNVKVNRDTISRSITVQVLEPDTLEIDRSLIENNNKYAGYKLERTDPTNVPNLVNNGDVIKVYYVKDNFNYTVEYYYDNVKDNDKTETGSALYQSIVDSYPDKNIPGYKFDKHENFPLTIGTNSANNVIKVYYVKDSFNYTIEYYYENVKDNTKTETGSALYQSTVDSYPDKNITGYKFDKHENFPLTIGANSADNVIKVYYVKDNFNYTVEYYYDNVKNNDKTETGSALYQSTVDSYPDKNITGYKFDKHENFPLTISANAASNVIKEYYVKDSFNYTVEYYYDNVKDDDKTETRTALYQSTVDSYPDKNITGYKFDKHENFPLTISENTDNNVIKVYYVKDNFNYTVEYYYDNVKDNDKTETGSALYQSTVDSYPDKNITGYKFDKHENFLLTISANAASNVIKVYYVKDSFNYTVEYYYDNVKDNSKTETNSAIYQSRVENYTEKNKIGYKFDKHENVPLTITENPDNNIIKVYYIKDNFNYTIEYYYDNEIDTTMTEINSVEYQSLIDSYPDKNITGYKFDKHENFPLSISENAANNIIKVYYVKDNFNYTIEYYYDNVKDSSKTETGRALYQSTIDNYTDKNIIGYKFDKHENVPLTISANPANNVIKVYYVKDSFNYRIEYYYDNAKDNSKTESGSALYQSTIDNYTDKNITGYKFDKTENLPLTITENADNNVIKIYYIKDNGNTKTLSYTVEYYKDNVKVEGDTETRTKTVQIIEPDTLDLDRSLINDNNKYVGYKLEKTIPANVPDVVNNGDVIKVYYIKDNFNYTIEYYYDNIKDNNKTETGLALYQSTINNYTDKNIPGYKFDKHENVPLTITENADNNVIKVYYVKASFEYCVEYYYDNERDDSKTENRLAEYQSTIDNYIDKNIVGYKFDKHENIPLTITENSDNNVIKVYYVKDSFNYTTEYYYNNVKDDTKTENGSAEYQSIIENYTDKKVDAYEFDRTENLPLTISENPLNNIIKVYYYPIRTLTVKHIDINTNEILGTSEESGREGKAITTSALDFTGYMLVKKPEVENYTLKPEAQIVNYYYAKISSGVVEKHINIVTDKYIADDVQYEGYVGKDYLTSSKDITDYDLVTNEKYYRIMAQKDENFLSNNGVTSVGELIEKLQVNAEETYIPENYKGKMTEEPIEVKYYYVKKAKVNVHYLDKNSKKPVHPEDTITGHEKDPYATTPIEIEGYDLVTETNYYPTNLDGEMGEDPIDIIFYYERKAEVEVNHICITDDSKIHSYKIEGHEKDSYKTQILDKDEYKNYRIITNKEYYEYATKKDKSILTRNNVTSVEALLEKLGLIETNPYIPENNSGEMTREKIVVNYYYKKQATIVVKYIDEETGEELSSTIDVLDYGEVYLMNPVNILDYMIDEGKMPTNYTGTVEKDSEEIVFYYRKVKQDNTVAPGKIPQTGENGIKIALSLLGVAAIIIISKRKTQKYKLSK